MSTEFRPAREDFAEVVRSHFHDVPYHEAAGITLESVTAGRMTAFMDRQPGLTQQNGFFHAASLIGLADTVAGGAAFSLMAEGENVLSASFAVSMLRPADCERLRAEGQVIKAGKRLYVCEARVFDSRDSARLLVLATVTLVAV